MKEKKLFKFNVEKSLLASLYKLNGWYVLLRMAVILMIYGICASIIITPHFKYTAFFLCPFMGFILAGFLNAAHDCIHCTHFVSKKTNRIMGMLLCLPTLTNYTIYCYQHLTHHRYTGVEGDTESRRIFPSIKAYFYSLTGIEFWRYTLKLIIKSVKGDFLPTINSEQRRNNLKFDNWMLLYWLLLLIILTSIFPKIMLFIFWIPLLFYAPIVIFTSLPEHYGCPEGNDLRYNTRSVITNKFVRFFLWNGNYHTEHHAYPGIPGINLHRLHKEIGNQFSKCDKSYIHFHWKLLRGLIKNAINRY